MTVGAVLTYLPVLGAMAFFFGAMFLQARAHPGAGTPLRAEREDG